MDVKKFTEASMLSSAFVVLSVLCIGLGFGYLGYIDFVVPAFVGIILLKCNLKYTIMSCVSSLILIIFVIGDLPSGIMMSQNMILGMVIAYFIKKDESIFDDLFFSSIAACIIMIFVDINFSTLTGYSLLKESRELMEFIPSILDSYKDLIFYLSIACLPLGTVIIGYIVTLLFAKRFKILNDLAINKSKIIKNFKNYGQFISCSRKNIYLGIFSIISISFINAYIVIDRYSYFTILITSIQYIILFFILQDSVSIITKVAYRISKSRGKVLIFQLFLIYLLFSYFKFVSSIIILFNLYFDYKYKIKIKYKEILDRCIIQK